MNCMTMRNDALTLKPYTLFVSLHCYGTAAVIFISNFLSKVIVVIQNQWYVKILSRVENKTTVRAHNRHLNCKFKEVWGILFPVSQ